MRIERERVYILDPFAADSNTVKQAKESWLSTRNKRIRAAVQLVILVLVAWGIAHSVRKSAGQLSSQRAELATQADEFRARAEQTSDPAQAAEFIQQASHATAAAENFGKLIRVVCLLPG